jgi:hypothetical protein
MAQRGTLAGAALDLDDPAVSIVVAMVSVVKPLARHRLATAP